MNDWLTITLVFFLIVQSVGVLLIYRNAYYQLKKMTIRIDKLQGQLQAYGSGTLGVGQRLRQAEAKLAKALDRQTNIESKDPSVLPYTQAGKLLRMGASTDEVMQACGLSRAEAELVALLNRAESKRR